MSKGLERSIDQHHIDYQTVEQYAKKIDIAFTRGDIEEILERAQQDGITDLRWAVWDWLDEFEGISHTRDLELFPHGDDDDANDEYALLMNELEHNK